MTTPTPTVGRIVLYRGKDGVARPAIVTHVHSQFCINLFAFPAGTPEEEAYEGIPGLRTSVTHAQPDQEPGCFPSWHWMPYQIQTVGTRHMGTPVKPNEVEDSPFNHGLSLYANGAHCRMEERDSARNERESYKRRLIEAQDSLAVHHRRADQAEARVRELEAMGNAAIMGQHSLHADMIGRWQTMRDAALHGIDGFNNDQTNAVLSLIDDHWPDDIKPCIAAALAPPTAAGAAGGEVGP